MKKTPRSVSKKNLHGVFLSIQKKGVLLTGPSGSGKSAIALNLLNNGHKLIVDDAPCFYKEGNKIIGECPKLLKNFLEVRGLGILNILKLFGRSAIINKHRLDIIIHLKNNAYQFKRLNLPKKQKIFGVYIPVFMLPATSPHLTILIECLVRNHILKQQGYDAQTTFSLQQEKYLEHV